LAKKKIEKSFQGKDNQKKPGSETRSATGKLIVTNEKVRRGGVDHSDALYQEKRKRAISQHPGGETTGGGGAPGGQILKQKAAVFGKGWQATTAIINGPNLGEAGGLSWDQAKTRPNDIK